MHTHMHTYTHTHTHIHIPCHLTTGKSDGWPSKQTPPRPPVRPIERLTRRDTCNRTKGCGRAGYLCRSPKTIFLYTTAPRAALWTSACGATLGFGCGAYTRFIHHAIRQVSYTQLPPDLRQMQLVSDIELLVKGIEPGTRHYLRVHTYGAVSTGRVLHPIRFPRRPYILHGHKRVFLCIWWYMMVYDGMGG